MTFPDDQPKEWELHAADAGRLRGNLGPVEARHMVIMNQDPGITAYNTTTGDQITLDDVRGEPWPAAEFGYGDPPDNWPGHHNI